MQYRGSDLEYLVPLWDRKLPDIVSQPIRDRLSGRDVNVTRSPVCEKLVGDVGPLAQDRFSASIIRQGASKGALK